MKFSKSTLGFYDESINVQIPDDAVHVSDQSYQELLEGQAAGKIIVADGEGIPFLAEPPAPTQEQLKRICKNEGKQRLLETDWSQTEDVALILSNKTEFSEYRAAVRELVIRPVPNPAWPVKPEAVWS